MAKNIKKFCLNFGKQAYCPSKKPENFCFLKKELDESWWSEKKVFHSSLVHINKASAESRSIRPLCWLGWLCDVISESRRIALACPAARKYWRSICWPGIISSAGTLDGLWLPCTKQIDMCFRFGYMLDVRPVLRILEWIRMRWFRITVAPNNANNVKATSSLTACSSMRTPYYGASAEHTDDRVNVSHGLREFQHTISGQKFCPYSSMRHTSSDNH